MSSLYRMLRPELAAKALRDKGGGLARPAPERGSGPICAPPSSLEAVLGLVKYPCSESQTADRADLSGRDEVRLIERTNPEKGTPNFQHPRPRPAMSGLRRRPVIASARLEVRSPRFRDITARASGVRFSPLGEARRLPCSCRCNTPTASAPPGPRRGASFTISPARSLLPARRVIRVTAAAEEMCLTYGGVSDTQNQ